MGYIFHKTIYDITFLIFIVLVWPQSSSRAGATWVQAGARKKIELYQSLRLPQTRPGPASPTRPLRRVMPPAACRLAEGLGGGAGPGRVWGAWKSFNG